jgi:hypothetical protein
VARRVTVLVVALLMAPLATAEAQTTPAAPAVSGAPSTATPPAGNPTNPRDFSANPHPTMPWFGVATPYGQFIRWLWVPPSFANVDGHVLQQPGYWVAETTSGYYLVDHWEIAQGPAGETTWRMVPRGFVAR